jgi:hypothetical protein
MADHRPRSDYMNTENLTQFDKAHVTLRIGILVSHFDDRQLMEALNEPDLHRYNVTLGHFWGDFSWVFAPRLRTTSWTRCMPSITHKPESSILVPWMTAMKGLATRL